MSKAPAIDILVLKTSLFENAKDLLDTLRTTDGIHTDLIELDPTLMADADWDEVIHRCLQAKKVVTL